MRTIEAVRRWIRRRGTAGARRALLIAGLLAQAGPDAAATPGHDMVLIPGGEFSMGIEGRGNASPPHVVRLYPFYIDRHEVTNAQYLEFCEAEEHGLPEFWGMKEYCSGPDFPGHPVVGVSWSDARAYARWRGLRLPTEAEWECAGRGGLVGKRFSHGDELDPVFYAPTGRTGSGGPSPVAGFAPNGFGLHDMTGNVGEWVADNYDADYYRHSPDANPQGPPPTGFKSIRGGGWHTGPGCSPIHFRNGLPGNWVDFNVGFRCAKSAGEPAALEVEREMEAAGREAGVRRFLQLREDFSGSFYIDETEIDSLAVRLIEGGRLDDALAVLELNAGAFPASYKAQNSLAKAHGLKGDRERAIEHYRRSLELYPEGGAAAEALAELGVSD